MKDDKKRTLTPKLRFPEFRQSDQWDEKAAGTLFANRTEPGEAELPIYSVTMYDGMVKRSSLDRQVDDIAEPAGNKKACKGDIAYNMMRMWQGAFGIASEDCMVSPAYVVLSPSTDVSPEFFGYMLKLPQSLRLLTNHSRGLTKDRLRLYYSDFARIPLYCPSLSEQQKIADCLTSLDELIAAHGRKLEALQVHKKGLMQQLFPCEGETLPRRRFTEFRDAPHWRERRISDLLKKASIPIEVQAAETYREIGVRSHGKGIFHKEPIRGSVIGEKRVFRVVEDAFVVNIVFAWEHAVATTSKDEAGMIASHRFPMYVPKSGDCDVRFLKFAFLTPLGKHLLGVASPGGAGRNRTLGQAEFEKLEIVVPGKEEQTKIADAIDAIDDLLVPQAKLLDALQTHKKGLMQRLFPSPDEVEV